MTVVKSQFGPTLVQMLAPRSLAVRVGAAAFALVLVVAVVAIALSTRPDETLVLEHEPVTFNFVYGPQFARDEEGAIVALRHARGGLFLDGFVVQPLELPQYRGVVSGMLPIYADGYIKGLRSRYRGFQFVGEGRTRINNGIGYQVTFRARTGTRTLYGRHLLLVEEQPDGQRVGVVIELTSTPAAGTPNAEEIGNHGALKTPLRSFRFGEDRKGGTA
ncbi:MAG TPA: hypothetical protein VMY78_08730 [Solirubrobacteraceae bacterium]|nr:hypothetical protein [Solirubrobacteraceae bacterium]